jgi:aminopeptidase 2
VLRTHKDGIIALWKWMTENWDVLEKKLPPALSVLGSVVSICTSSFTHEDQAAEIRKFFADRKTKGFDQSLAQSLDAIKAKSIWVERDGADVKQWLEQGSYF